MVRHSIQALHAENQMEGVRMVGVACDPQLLHFQLEGLNSETSVMQLYRKQNVLDPNGMSEDVAGRTWLKGVAERRGP